MIFGHGTMNEMVFSLLSQHIECLCTLETNLMIGLTVVLETLILKDIKGDGNYFGKLECLQKFAFFSWRLIHNSFQRCSPLCAEREVIVLGILIRWLCLREKMLLTWLPEHLRCFVSFNKLQGLNAVGFADLSHHWTTCSPGTSWILHIQSTPRNYAAPLSPSIGEPGQRNGD